MQLSDETKKELDVFFQSSLTSLTKAVDGTTSAIRDNAPLIAKEIVVAKLIDSSTFLAVSVAIFATALTVMLQMWHIESRTEFQSFVCIISILVSIGSLCAASCAISAVAQAIFTPRLVIFDYVKDILKKNETKSE